LTARRALTVYKPPVSDDKLNFSEFEWATFTQWDIFGLIVCTARLLNCKEHWRRQLWGTGARAPPRLPAS